MSSLVTLFMVIAVTSPALSYGIPRNVDSNVLLNILNQQHDDEHDSDASADSSDSLDADTKEKANGFDTGKIENIINLLSKLNIDKTRPNVKDNRKDREKVSFTKRYKDVNKFGTSDNENSEALIIQNLLSKGFNQISEPRALREEYNNNRIPNALNPAKLDSYNKENDLNSLDQYSKIYVVLNPSAVSKSKDNYSLNDLLAKLLSKSALVQNGQPHMKHSRFPLKSVARRARRESNEMYAPKNSMEDDYKQKRARGAGGGSGGGGGAGGRTAIPYIRHRGDIYERDN